MQFIDLKTQQRQISGEIDLAINRVLEHGQYVLGPEVQQLEKQLASYCNASYAVSCANGTDALALALMALEIKPGDAVFCPSFTFVATAQVIPWLGALPVFVDIDPNTYNMDADSLENAILDTVSKNQLKPRAVIAVDLFGQSADYKAISRVTEKYGLTLISDNAQGFGCRLDGKSPTHWADIATTSFFPAKPLGCYGDGGAVFTNDKGIAERVESLRMYGKVMPSDLKEREFKFDSRYLSLRVGMNSRLDTIQAAILLEKLKIFEEEVERRQKIADRYSEELQNNVLQVPFTTANSLSVWAQYVIEHSDRDGLRAKLQDEGIPTAVYYPVPIHLQDFAIDYPREPNQLRVSEDKASRVIALPMHPYLLSQDQDRIIDVILNF